MAGIGLGHFTFLHLDPAALVRLARTSGFDFVGLRFHPVAPGLPHWLPDAAGLKTLAEVLRGEGIGLYDIETVVIDAAFDPQTLVPAMEAAAGLGARRVNCCADLFPSLTETFATLCALAQERGLGIDLEPMRWRGVNTPAACLSLITESAAPNAGYLVDTLHHHRCGGTPAEIAQMPSGLVRSAQISDAPALAPEGTGALLAEARGARLLPGEGALPLRDTLRALPSDTVLSVELPNAAPSDELARAKAIHAATSALLNDL